ncbi:MAG: universal stress protein [Blastocatellia bacterium]
MTNRMKVIVAYDGSECADAALDDLWNAGLPGDTRFKVLSVVERWAPLPSEFEVVEHVDHNDEYRILAMRAATRLRSMYPGCEVDVEVGAGSPATAIIERADEWKPDLIVVGSHGRTALGRFFFGSVSQKVSHEAHCSTRVSRGRVKEPGAPVRLMVAVDGSKGAEVAARSAASREWPEGSEALVVNASWTVPPITPPLASGQIINWVTEENVRVKAAIDQAVAWLDGAGLKAESVIEEGVPKEVLIKEAENWGADCVFLGARGRGRLERFLIGSVSSAVVARAHCSVEVAREQR